MGNGFYPPSAYLFTLITLGGTAIPFWPFESACECRE
jgi:hypothetical protein